MALSFEARGLVKDNGKDVTEDQPEANGPIMQCSATWDRASVGAHDGSACRARQR